MQFKRFPLAAIVGQEQLQKAYLANIIDPKIGGLLVSGPKGSGKSTVVHAVETILPEYQAIKECIFNCDPAQPEQLCSFCESRKRRNAVTKQMKIITLPLSCTEDRLIGSIDIERLLKTGEKKVIPGILGQAHRNILYIDEVNLLPDHLVDDVLDAAALHWNVIEREGVSVNHPAEFILVGTMNPEEGDLRPQILDRFPLCVKLASVVDPSKRVEIVKRNLLFENDPKVFYDTYESEHRNIGRAIVSARSLLAKVAVDERFIDAVARSCAELKVDGQRPDIVIVKTARSLAALAQRALVKSEDIYLGAELALVHRTRDGGLMEPPTSKEIADVFEKNVKHCVPKAQEQMQEKGDHLDSTGDIVAPVERTGRAVKKNKNR